jgi:hypothetical protein
MLKSIDIDILDGKLKAKIFICLWFLSKMCSQFLNLVRKPKTRLRKEQRSEKTSCQRK